ncbi:MAG TPA: secretin N-terminal domain-containing protein, partial [Candidatus Babeliales bacterium]|nr:secretin N-terminal domain-containing protein [Candidatus Babeliales bacterium]
FKTNDPVTRQEAWNLFITFLNISGFSIVQQPDPSIYRIQTIQSAQRAPIPTFIGVHYETLPENDEMIRYLYFIENATIESMRAIIPSLQSGSAAAPIWLSEQKAFILTDLSYNIRALMAIVKELDKVTMPQAMSVLKLRQADAVEVKKLYDELTSQTDQGSAFRPFGARKQPTAIYFPENAKIIAEPRTNSLIILGPQDVIAKIEDFIVKHVDVALDQPYSPLYTYQLQYADAKTIAEIMNTTTKLGQNTEVGKAGGVRGSDKYLQPMNFTAEPSTNKLIIKGDYQDYMMAKQIIEDLDKPQPQVAIDVLILSVRLIDNKQIGTQLRSKIPGLDGILGQNVKFQTSGLRAGGAPSGIVTNTSGNGVDRLLGNLINLVTQAPVGNTIVTFGQDLFGVWGLFQALRTITNVQVVSNPFLFASNKTPAKVSIGETRRVVSGTIQSGDVTTETRTDDQANLSVEITPQINSDGMIVLALKVDITEFTDPEDPNSARKTTKLVQTQAIVGDREVLALGGLIRDISSTNVSKTPLLGDIPLIGWLFKNKAKAADKDSLLILMSTKIIPPHATSDVNEYTKERLYTYRSTMGEIGQSDSPQDPIHRLFFADKKRSDSDLGEFIFDRHQRSRRANKQNRKKNKHKMNAAADDRPQLAQASRQRGRRRRGRNRELPEVAPVLQETITIAQSPTLTTIAAPSEKNTVSNTPELTHKKRRSRSLSSFLTSDESEKVA